MQAIAAVLASGARWGQPASAELMALQANAGWMALSVSAVSKDPPGPGPPGTPPIVRRWEPRIYDAGAWVVRDGAIFQAQEQTGKEWHQADWLCVVEKPADGRSFEICDTYDPNIAYRALSVVTLNNSWFIAKRDNPGPCPGEDWKSGPVGKRGKDGVPGSAASVAFLASLGRLRSTGRSIPVLMRDSSDERR
jgi:hypothetical protein